MPDSILREALELIIAGDNMAAAFVLTRGTPMSLDDAVDGLMEIEAILNGIVAGSDQTLFRPSFTQPPDGES